MRRELTFVSMLVSCAYALVTARAAADPPAASQSQDTPRPVRTMGGPHGPPGGAQVQPAQQPAPAPTDNNQPPEALREARDKMHAKMDEAREKMKQARDEMREAAQKSPDQAREAMEKARNDAREAMQEAKQAMQQAHTEITKSVPGANSPEGRMARMRYARRAAWHGIMGRIRQPADIPPPMREELRHHGRRIAMLQRIRALAADKHDDASVARVDKLIAREQTRHHDKLERLNPPAQGAADQAPKPASAQRHDPEEDEQEGEP